jgi:hypothetical protein
VDQEILLQLVHLKEIMEEQEVEVIHFIMEEVVVELQCSNGVAPNTGGNGGIGATTSITGFSSYIFWWRWWVELVIQRICRNWWSRRRWKWCT